MFEHDDEQRNNRYDNLHEVGIVVDRKMYPKRGPLLKVAYPDRGGIVSGWLAVMQDSTVGKKSFKNHRKGARGSSW